MKLIGKFEIYLNKYDNKVIKLEIYHKKYEK